MGHGAPREGEDGDEDDDRCGAHTVIVRDGGTEREGRGTLPASTCTVEQSALDTAMLSRMGL
jgi:hypothetical protein